MKAEDICAGIICIIVLVAMLLFVGFSAFDKEVTYSDTMLDKTISKESRERIINT